eukprot:CAMPEP_0184868694 /NCGR_PEP_ID=MMETSP0580-20130426/31408_1 /TAXON_ID=1118495 /ORGANISM="Dactyliosolen fragilissimus" /LENGTH=255 /DNA_ID=CAMNT_0027369749 /DNA_START=869 /DNA_END=1636 /DNA_ORIENTATION=+
MESLGGDQKWWVRFLAQHSAIVYYVVLTILWAISPSLSYKFSELLETHAVDTYSQFLDENQEQLKLLPPPNVAIDYYAIGLLDPMFGEYQTSALVRNQNVRKSGFAMNTLYDVFEAIRSDEGDHVSTMKACQDPMVPVISPSLENRVLVGASVAVAIGYLLGSGEFTELLSLSDTFEISEVVDGTEDAVLSNNILDTILGGAAGMLSGLKNVDKEINASELLDVSESTSTTLLSILKKNMITILKALGILEIFGL